MDPRSRWILRPAGVCVVGTLMVLCGLAAAGGALAATGPAILRPDAPPSGAVVSPTPDQPSRAVRMAMRCELRPPLPVSVAPADVSHPVARPHERPRLAAATKPARAVFPALTPAQRSRTRSCSCGRAACPTVSEPSWPPRSRESATEGLDRGITALAGTFLAMVALGAGCLTVAVSRVARGR